MLPCNNHYILRKKLGPKIDYVLGEKLREPSFLESLLNSYSSSLTREVANPAGTDRTALLMVCPEISCAITQEREQLLKNAVTRLGLSARALRLDVCGCFQVGARPHSKSGTNLERGDSIPYRGPQLLVVACQTGSRLH